MVTVSVVKKCGLYHAHSHRIVQGFNRYLMYPVTIYNRMQQLTSVLDQLTPPICLPAPETLAEPLSLQLRTHSLHWIHPDAGDDYTSSSNPYNWNCTWNSKSWGSSRSNRDTFLVQEVSATVTFLRAPSHFVVELRSGWLGSTSPAR